VTVRPHRLRLHGRNPVQWVTGNAVAPWFLQLNPATRRRRTAMSHLLHCPCISPARIGPTRSGARTHHCATVAAAPAHRLEPPRVAPGRGATGAPVVSARCIASFGPPRVAAGRRRGLGRLSNVRLCLTPVGRTCEQTAPSDDRHSTRPERETCTVEQVRMCSDSPSATRSHRPVLRSDVSLSTTAAPLGWIRGCGSGGLSFD
jgi:hypothetical protein